LRRSGRARVSIQVEDFEPEAAIVGIPSERGLFLKVIGAEMKDVFGMGKENMPTTMS